MASACAASMAKRAAAASSGYLPSSRRLRGCATAMPCSSANCLTADACSFMPRPAGRGMKLQASAVKQFALEQGIAVAQPRSLRLDGKYPDDAAAARLAIEAAQADAMVVAAYGLILPQWVLDVPTQ